jgi:aryl-alcohol dehydrogenase-like predicted oxidoreductase
VDRRGVLAWERQGKSLKTAFINDSTVANIKALNAIAGRRGQTLAQMALAWVLRKRCSDATFRIAL